MVTILYDRFCPLCCTLASWLESDLPTDWQLLAWQDYPERSELPKNNEINPGRPQEICVREERGEWLVGQAAWHFLVEREPHLQAMQALAFRLGIAPKHSARWVRRLAHGLRRLCRSCSARR